MKEDNFVLPVRYEPAKVAPDDLANALDALFDNALSTPGILSDFGPVSLGTLECPLPREQRRYVLYNMDTDELFDAKIRTAEQVDELYELHGVMDHITALEIECGGHEEVPEDAGT